ncbi:MAG: family 16 glycosylhydrolase [Anaerolineales bacterium]|nr:family 16 glycosylhydrolase [Anaerolineales bacterium]
MPQHMTARTAGSGHAQQDGDVWRFSLGAGRGYHLAQLDDYAGIPRRRFTRRAPLRLSLRARASHADLPGTWGFGLWNDPFGFSLGLGGGSQLPTLPNAAWFMFASPRNHLSFNDALPGNGGQAAVYRSPRIPSLLLTPGLLVLPLLALPPTARGLRRLASALVQQEATVLTSDPRQWHNYELLWQAEQVEFLVDGQNILSTKIAPRPPLSLVLWLDNQYAAWLPSRRMHYGTEEPRPESWVEIRDLQVQ